MKGSMKEMVGGCCVCSDERGWPENPLVYCDGQGCTVAVHQACYGIVTVPTGPWYCRKCESQERAARVRCELCPSRDGALKRTDNSGWAHVVCALYIPEVRFGNVTTMEPIILQLIPPERFNKVCYICEELGKGGRSTIGACMQCNKTGCKQQFHVTCAQALGLLCEEAGNYLDNVKYCGYCQHHYSKLKKGGNVKTIPPYKPIPNDNHSSDSSPEKEAENTNTNNKTVQQLSSSSSSGKRKSNSSNNKSSSSSSKSSASTNKSNSTATSSHQKTVHSSSSSKVSGAVDKSKSYTSSTSVKSVVKNTDSESAHVLNSHSVDLDKNSTDKSSSHSATKDSSSSNSAQKFPNTNFSESVTPAGEGVFENSRDSNLSSSSVKDSSKVSKKRKAGSRTPTPNSITQTDTERSASIVSVTSSSVSATQSVTTVSTSASDRRDSIGSTDSLEKPKKAKTEPSPPLNPPASHLTNLRTASSPSVLLSEQLTTVSNKSPSNHTVTTSTATHSQQNSLVVSVPLTSTSLSPISNQSNTNLVGSSVGLYQHLPELHPSGPNTNNGAQGGTLHDITSTSLDSTMVSSDGGLKIAYEKQPTANSSSLSRLSAETPPVVEETPAKRSRSQSADKSEKMGRNKKRGSNGVPVLTGPASGVGKRASRSQHATPSPVPSTGAFSSITQHNVKESPPSSPSDESIGAPSGRRSKGRKSAPATVTSASIPSSSTASNSKQVDQKDVKVFQNGVHAPHMLGNQLNPNSNMAQKMSDHLHSELEAHSIFNQSENNSSNLVGPQLHSKVIASVRSSNSTSGSAASSSSGLSSMLGGGAGGTIPQTLDQLLERQWEQGSQFLMEQAQHFDIASLLSCLHQLRAENLRLEEHVNSLLQRRDHLLAVNARLAIPLTNQNPVVTPSNQHTINNLHPSVLTVSHGDAPRSRHSGGFSGHAGSSLENGLPPDGAAYPHQHRSPANSQPPQPSPTIRHSPAGSGYPSTSGHGVVRSGNSDGGRSSQQRQQTPYPHYQGQVPVVTTQQQPQMVMRRDSDLHHQVPSSKPS